STSCAWLVSVFDSARSDPTGVGLRRAVETHPHGGGGADAVLCSSGAGANSPIVGSAGVRPAKAARLRLSGACAELPGVRWRLARRRPDPRSLVLCASECGGRSPGTISP